MSWHRKQLCVIRLPSFSNSDKFIFKATPLAHLVTIKKDITLTELVNILFGLGKVQRTVPKFVTRDLVVPHMNTIMEEVRISSVAHTLEESRIL